MVRLLRQAPRGCPPWGGAAHPEPRRRVERGAAPPCQSVTSTPLPPHPSFRPPRAGIHPRGQAAHPEPRRRVERGAAPPCQSVTSTPLPPHPSFRPPRAGIHPRGRAAHPEPRRRVERMRDIISPTIPSPLFSLSSRGSALKVRRGGRYLGLAHSHVYLPRTPPHPPPCDISPLPHPHPTRL